MPTKTALKNMHYIHHYFKNKKIIQKHFYQQVTLWAYNLWCRDGQIEREKKEPSN